MLQSRETAETIFREVIFTFHLHAHIHFLLSWILAILSNNNELVCLFVLLFLHLFLFYSSIDFWKSSSDVSLRTLGENKLMIEYHKENSFSPPEVSCLLEELNVLQTILINIALFSDT